MTRILPTIVQNFSYNKLEDSMLSYIYLKTQSKNIWKEIKRWQETNKILLRKYMMKEVEAKWLNNFFSIEKKKKKKRIRPINGYSKIQIRYPFKQFYIWKIIRWYRIPITIRFEHKSNKKSKYLLCK